MKIKTFIAFALSFGACTSPEVTILDFTPKQVYPGALLRVEGSNFEKVTSVRFAGGFSAKATKATDHFLWVEVPRGAQSGTFQIGDKHAPSSLEVLLSEIIDPDTRYRALTNGSGSDVFCGLTTEESIRCWSKRPPNRFPRKVVTVPGSWSSLDRGEPHCGVRNGRVGACWRIGDAGETLVSDVTDAGWEHVRVGLSEDATVLEYATWSEKRLAYHGSRQSFEHTFENSISEILMSPSLFVLEGKRLWLFSGNTPTQLEPALAFVDLAPVIIAVSDQGQVLDLWPPAAPLQEGVRFPVAVSNITGEPWNSCAVDIREQLWCAGYSARYDLINGTITGTGQAPVLKGVVSVAGIDSFCAARTAGGVVCFSGDFAWVHDKDDARYWTPDD